MSGRARVTRRWDSEDTPEDVPSEAAARVRLGYLETRSSPSSDQSVPGTSKFTIRGVSAR